MQIKFSSIVYEAIRTIFSFIFLLRRILQHKKRKTNNVQSLRSFCAQKIVAFVVFYLLIFVLLVSFRLFRVFYAAGFFLKKNKVKNFPDSLIYYTTVNIVEMTLKN